MVHELLFIFHRSRDTLYVITVAILIINDSNLLTNYMCVGVRVCVTLGGDWWLFCNIFCTSEREELRLVTESDCLIEISFTHFLVKIQFIGSVVLLLSEILFK